MTRSSICKSSHALSLTEKHLTLGLKLNLADNECTVLISNKKQIPVFPTSDENAIRELTLKSHNNRNIWLLNTAPMYFE